MATLVGQEPLVIVELLDPVETMDLREAVVALVEQVRDSQGPSLQWHLGNTVTSLLCPPLHLSHICSVPNNLCS